jgi:AmmeMemoRadiSam system protein B/AmmeMemoRadiSam system protein A
MEIMKNFKKIILIIFAFFILLIVSGCISSQKEIKKEMIIKKPNVAGYFYPKDKDELSSMISAYLSYPEKNFTKIKGIVSPHAGYIYSGPVAAYGYKQIENEDYETVIIIAPSHYSHFYGFSIPNATHYETPLGLVEFSEKNEELRKDSNFFYDLSIHEKEHAIEVQIPFLQKVLKKFKIIPIVVGDIEPKTLADILSKYIDDKTLVIASSDLSHYHSYEEARSIDAFCVNSIPILDFENMKYCEACGKIPILTLMYLAKKFGWEGKLIDYRNSGDTSGDKSRVVGYASIIFYEKGYSHEEKEFLLKLARETLENYLSGKKIRIPEESELTEKLKEVRGCFVTLNKFGNLRGCIGHIIPQEELYKCVIDNAINAAVNDPRFRPVSYEELKDIKIEISVLSLPKPLFYSSQQELLEKLRPRVDGVVIKYKGRTSTYLPQVWEMIPNKEDFLSELCLKQGSPSDCWKKEDVVIETYQAEVWEEE